MTHHPLWRFYAVPGEGNYFILLVNKIKTDSAAISFPLFLYKHAIPFCASMQIQMKQPNPKACCQNKMLKNNAGKCAGTFLTLRREKVPKVGHFCTNDSR